MTVKQSVLDLLLGAHGQYVSGEQMAADLHVTRAAIWKSINQLRQEGFSINAGPNKGYAIAQDADIVTEAGIKRYLPDDSFFTFEIHDSVESTNGLMRERTERDQGYTIVAREQTRGVGRLNRHFFSPKNTGIYFSVLLKPSLEASETVNITTMAAVAVCRAVQEVCGRKPGIKWVNDIYLDGKKLCGILTQGSFSMENRKTEYIILGIGINIYAPNGGFPGEIADTAGYLLARQEANIKNRLIAGVLTNFRDIYSNMQQSELYRLYRQYSIVVGRRVMVHGPNGAVPATVLDINEQCNLVVEYDDARRDTLSCGEITITV